MSLLFLVSAGAFSASSTDVPIYMPRMPVPRVRLYDGTFTGSNIRIANLRVTDSGRPSVAVPNCVFGTSYTDGGGGLSFSLPARPGQGKFLLVMMAWTGNATLTGWVDETFTTLAFKQVTGMTVGIYGRYISGNFGLGLGASRFALFSADTEVTYFAAALEGIKSASFTDVSTNNTGTSTSASTGTTSATAQADEISLAIMGMPVSTRGAAPNFTTSGYQEYYSSGAATHYALMGSLITTATGAQAAAATMPESGTWVGAIATLKADSASTKYDAVGEFDLCSGKATRSPLNLGTIDITVSGADPVSSQIKKSSILEVYMADGSNGWTFEWYYVMSVDKDESGPLPVYTIKGFDLRVLVWDRAIAAATLDNVRGSLANYAVENWVRKYIDTTCITINAGQPYLTTDTVPNLALEASTGNRGTVYISTSPAESGAKLGETIAKLYGKDALGWRIVLLNAGTSTAKLEVQTYQGTDRRFGSASEMVFAEQWDTASQVAVIDDAQNALTAATVYGPPLQANPAARPMFYVKDTTAIQKWGFRYGSIDASSEIALDSTIATAYLQQRLPKTYLSVVPRNTPRYKVKTNYDLFDRVTALDRDGNQYDGYIMQMQVTIGGAAEVQLSDLDRQGIIDEYSVSYNNPYVTPPGALSMVVTDDPTSQTYVDRGAYQSSSWQAGTMFGIPDRTVLYGYTGSIAHLNYVASVTPGTVTANKAVVVGASKNIDTLVVTTLKAGAGANGNVADGATYNPNGGTHLDSTGWLDGTAQADFNSLLAKLRTANVIS